MSTTWTTISTNSVTQSLADQAETSATNAATSATNAGTSETNAATSATSAATSATPATTQATASASSATSAAASLAEFNGIYYGSSSSAPTESLAAGDIYFNSSSDQLQVYNGSTWQAGVTDTSGLQPIDADLTAIAALSSADGNVIVGSASGWVAESGATARTSLGLGSIATETATDYLAKAGGTMTATLTLHSSGVEFSDGTTLTTAPTSFTTGKAIAMAIVFG